MRKISFDEGMFKKDAKILSLKEMAEKYGMKECTISKWKKMLDVITVQKNIPLPNKEEFAKDIELYPNVVLAEKYGVCKETISDWRKRLGLANIWRSALWVEDEFKKDAVELRWNVMCSKYGISRSCLKYWKERYGLTTGKKEKRKITWSIDGRGCWICTSHKIDGRGYPQCKGDRLVAKRMWCEKNGAWPDELVVCHSCDNKLCINPEHIFPGTMKVNQEGMADRDRSPWGIRSGARRLTPEQAKEIYALKDSSLSQRAVGEMYGVGGTTIWYIWNGKTWWRDNAGVENSEMKLTENVVGNLTSTDIESLKSIIKDGIRVVGKRHKIDKNVINTIRSLKGRASSRELADILGVSHTIILKIWRSVG